MKLNSGLLKKQAEIYGIRVVYKLLPEGLLGEANADAMTITLDMGLLDDPRQHACVLAEEIGHILLPPRPGHVRYHSRGFYQQENCSLIKHTVAQDERKARDWATSVLLGHVTLCRIQSIGATSIKGLADCLGTEPWLITHRISYLRRKEHAGGRKAKWRDLIKRQK